MKITTALAAFLIIFCLGACRKGQSDDLKGIHEELKKSNVRVEEMQRNQIKEREGKALENQKSYFR